MSRVRGLLALPVAGLIWAAAAPTAQAGVTICNHSRNNEDIRISFILVDISWGPTQNTVERQGGWITVRPGRCSEEFRTNRGYYYVEGSKGGVWRSQTPGTNAALRTFEPQTGRWCVNRTTNSEVWPNYGRKITSTAPCPAGFYLVYADIVPIYGNVIFTMDIR